MSINNQQHDDIPNAAPAIHDRRAMLAGIGGLAAGALFAGKAGAGPLNPPPGPISPTPGPEPRIPINAQNTPGNSQAVFQISQPGSYYLTGNVTGISGRSGIVIAASNVTVDLMGYAVTGVAGSINGIFLSGSSASNIQIRNGSVRNWGSVGLAVQRPRVRVSDIVASGNGSVGIRVGDDGSATNCTASFNGSNGITGDFDCTISHCNASQNSASGIVVNTGGSVIGCVANRNTVRGISVGADSVVQHCVARGNQNRGIEGNWSCIITQCNASNNGDFGIFILNGEAIVTECTARSNIGGGIRVFQRCLVKSCICASNTGPGAAGIAANSSRNRIESNQCTGNPVGIQAGGIRNLFLANTCGSNITNWEIPASNYCWAPAIIPTSAINGASGGGFSPFGGNTPDPLANYSY